MTRPRRRLVFRGTSKSPVVDHSLGSGIAISLINLRRNTLAVGHSRALVAEGSFSPNCTSRRFDREAGGQRQKDCLSATGSRRPGRGNTILWRTHMHKWRNRDPDMHHRYDSRQGDASGAASASLVRFRCQLSPSCTWRVTAQAVLLQGWIWTHGTA